MCYPSLVGEVIPWLGENINPLLIPCQYRVKSMILV